MVVRGERYFLSVFRKISDFTKEYIIITKKKNNRYDHAENRGKKILLNDNVNIFV